MMLTLDFISLAIGIFGIILAIAFYLKGRRIKRMSFSSKTFALINDNVSSIPGFSAQYRGNALDRLKATKVLIWNSGTETIESNDFASTAPLSLVFPDASTILEAKLSECSSEYNKVDVSIGRDKNSEANIEFEYFAKREGFLISILHTSVEDEPLINGVIKGGGKLEVVGDHRWIKFVIPFFIALGSGVFAGLIQRIEFSVWWVIPVLVFVSIFSGIGFLEKLIKRKSQTNLDEKFDGLFDPKELG